MKYQIVYVYPDNHSRVNIPDSWILIGFTRRPLNKIKEVMVDVVVCLEPLEENNEHLN